MREYGNLTQIEGNTIHIEMVKMVESILRFTNAEKTTHNRLMNYSSERIHEYNPINETEVELKSAIHTIKKSMRVIDEILD